MSEDVGSEGGYGRVTERDDLRRGESDLGRGEG